MKSDPRTISESGSGSTFGGSEPLDSCPPSGSVGCSESRSVPQHGHDSLCGSHGQYAPAMVV
jgi:hypothetical protein